MKNKTKSCSITLKALVLFSILSSFMALAAPVQSEQPTITETRINNNDSAKALTTSTKEVSGNIEVTVYNADMALVKEKREIYLNNGINSIEYTNVTSNIDLTSVLLEDPTNNRTTVLEQQYEYDLVSSSNLDVYKRQIWNQLLKKQA